MKSRLLKSLASALSLLTLLLSGAVSGSSQSPAEGYSNSFPFEIQRGNRYIGHQICSGCHPAIAKEHESSHHARTWSRVDTPPFTFGSRFTSLEGSPPPVVHQVAPGSRGLSYQVQLPSGEKAALPVHSIVGGKRFGYSFLLEASALNGVELARPAIIEGRYMLRTKLGRLSISPGLPAEKPVSFETAFGRVLTPSFAAKCLDCHGGLSESKAAEHPIYKDTAVRCERCHGPGGFHLEAVRQKSEDLQIVHPGKMSADRQLLVCGQCHGGFKPISSPRPQDVLISAQVVALRNTLCFEGSDGKFSCLSCHNPHRNASHGDPAYERTCLSCHRTPGGQTLCSVNPAGGCVGCHMPVVTRPGSFELTDHWIRIIPKSP
jgi:hypothetical protein